MGGWFVWYYGGGVWGVGFGGGGKGEVEDGDGGGAEAGVDGEEAADAFKQESGADEEEGGEGDFGDDEGAAEAALATSAGGAASAGGLEVRGQERGREAEQERGEGDDGDGEGDGGAVELEFVEAGQGRQREHAEEADGPPGEEEAEGAAEGGEGEAFGEELAKEAGAGGTEGGADGELPLAAGGAGEQEVGEVAADSEQEDAHGDGEQVERRPDFAGDGVGEGFEGGAVAAVGLGVELFVAFAEGEDLLAGGFDGGAGTEAADGFIDMGVAEAGVGGADGDGCPAGGGLGELEAGGHDADDFVVVGVEGEFFAKDGGVAAVAAEPPGVGEDDEAVLPELVFAGGEGAAVERPGAEEGEEVEVGGDGFDLFGFAGAGVDGAVGVEGVGGEDGEGLGVLAVIEEVGHGDALLLFAIGGGDAGEVDEGVGLGVGEWAQENAIDEREDDDIGADSQRQRQ